MTKIKIVGVLIFSISILLALLSSQISKHNKANNDFLDIVNAQKAFTQDIAKNIFFIYRYRKTSTSELDKSIKAFINNMKKKDRLVVQKNAKDTSDKLEDITNVWNNYYLLVQKFRDTKEIVSPYANILLENLVNNIYHTNINLVMEFDELIKLHNIDYESKHRFFKTLQLTLFACLVMLLIYLFTQLKGLILFVQKFLSTSKKIITNSTIKELEPINIKNNNKEILLASNNFNFLVEKINNSIENSSHSIEHSYNSLNQVEKDIEDFLELIYTMQDEQIIDKELTKREDALIHSLEELTTSTKKLQNLKIDLDALVSTCILKA